jgi:hypothetical protein
MKLSQTPEAMELKRKLREAYGLEPRVETLGRTDAGNVVGAFATGNGSGPRGLLRTAASTGSVADVPSWPQ